MLDFHKLTMLFLEVEMMKSVGTALYKRNTWIFMYIEKYYEDKHIVRYKYLIDSSDINNAGKIEISKKVEFILTDDINKKMKLIENYFQKKMIKIICCPKNIADKTKDIEDYNAVYAVKTVIEQQYWTGIYDDHFTRVAAENFESYACKYIGLFESVEDENCEVDLIDYHKEFILDHWLYIKAEKIYEDRDILKYKFFVDTFEKNDYSIMQFSKNLKITNFKNYIRLYDRLKNKGLLKTEKFIDNDTADDIIYNRRSVIAMKYILEHKADNKYFSHIIIINENMYNYYCQVTDAIKCFELDNEE